MRVHLRVGTADLSSFEAKAEVEEEGKEILGRASREELWWLTCVGRRGCRSVEVLDIIEASDRFEEMADRGWRIEDKDR